MLLSAAIGSGSGAVFNGVLTAMNGGSIADIAESASDGFMWGGIGGSLGGSTTVLLSELAAAGSSLIGNPFVQRLVQGAADTAVDTAQSASKGLPVTLEGVLINMTYNTLMAGGIGSGGKQAVNEAVDETADSIGDSVRREVKSGGKGNNYSNDIAQYEKLKSQYAADEIYNAERIGSALKDDPTHRAASYLSGEQLGNGRTYSFRGGDNKPYTLLQTKGQLDGVDGIFEYITNSAGQVTHQRFIKNGTYTGFPNQVVPKGGY